MLPSTKDTLQAYYMLTKPGIIYGNGLSTAAGFFVASQGRIDWWLLVATLFGISFVIASGCVLNNYLDRGIDKKMARTKHRALVSGKIPLQHALIFAGVLCVLGFAILAMFTTLITVYVGLVGLYVYVVAYGIWKRRSPVGTVVGSISGATPILAGYTAVTGHFDTVASLIFLAMVYWQMPHFYAIAMYRLSDYRAAGIPVLPAVKGLHQTKIQILIYIVAFTVTTLLLSVFGYTGIVFAVICGLCGAYWFYKGVSGFRATNDEAWARGMFKLSLFVLLAFCVSLAASPFLP